MTDQQDKSLIIEAAILAAGEPVTVERMIQLFPENEAPSKKDVKKLLDQVAENYADRGIELKEVASGYRFQARQEFAPWLQRLWEKKPARYSRALMETLALVIYKQPITRGEIEDVRGVAVSSNIMKTLMDHEWVKIVGQKEVPGKPALFGTTKKFLDYFNIKSIAELPTLEEIANLDEIGAQLGDKLGEQLKLEVNASLEITGDDNEPENVLIVSDAELELLESVADEIKPQVKENKVEDSIEKMESVEEEKELELVEDDDFPQEAFA